SIGSCSFFANSGSSRFADYFVICGLDTESGLEPDELSGKPISRWDKILSDVPYTIPASTRDSLYL
uniref:Uncharacterized protein n=1 Tax=Xiphophorus couchianus TaxID=32473 RepID=A0A3B5LZU5_9TELE